MRKVYAWLGAATLFMLATRAEAANDVLKPYVVLILDTSGSMNVATGSGPTSCGKKDTRINHAVCAVNNIVSSYGDMVFSFGRFRETTTTTMGTQGSLVCDSNNDQEGNAAGFPGTLPLPSGGDVCNTQGAICGDCNPSTGVNRYCFANDWCLSNVCSNLSAETSCTDSIDNDNDGLINDGCPTFSGSENATFNGANGCLDNIDNDGDGRINEGCPPTGLCGGSGFGCTNADSNFEVLTALVDGNNGQAAEYTNGVCNTCNVDRTGNLDPEIWGVSANTFTPLSATLLGAKRYWEGQQATNGTVIHAEALNSNTEQNPGFDPINRDPSAHVFIPANDNANCSAQAGCQAFTPETACTGDTVDNDSDGRVNDGCAAVGAAETSCADTIDNDNDGTINDGCQAWCSGSSCCCAEQCRPYITILLTDGDETCTSFTNTTASAASLLATTPRTDAHNITAGSRVNGVVTLTVANPTFPNVPHPFKVGDQVLVLAASFGGTHIVTAASSTTVSYAFAGNGGTVAAGSVRHTASLNRYRVETKPIGFGIAPGDPEIEAIAHAGGAPDLPGVNEGFYAQDEADLELAISEILADSVRAELCNARDDDCDVRIDEDFPNKGGACTNGLLGVCARNGTLECRTDGTGLQCNAPAVAPGSEGTVCNSADDDCDGRIDENLNCTSCVPTNEICNNADEDCDGTADEGLTRPCGVGVCSGIETCTAGTYSGCTAPPSNPEICDGLDNDCDGLCDGFDVGCSEQVQACDPANGSSCPAVDSLGHSSKNPIPENICRPGVRTCPLKGTCGGGNSYGICSGEVKACGPDAPPGQGCDICNGLDDDCDNEIDEDFVDADCSTNCGVGRTVCTNGQIMCDSTQATTDATCNNQDDDCDGKFDEDWQCPDVAPADGQCDECGNGLVCMGMPKCTLGQVVCEGGPIGNETCNCLDDNCNNMVDEGTLCPTGSECVNCQCAFRCAEGEFPCPLGKKCEGTGTDRFCVNDPCFNVTCPAVNGNQQTCQPKPGFPNEPECVDTCSLVNDSDTMTYPPCAPTFVCFGPAGECRPNNCTTFPDMCTGQQSCINGMCVSNPCQGVTCDSGQYCVGGTCVSSCADVECPDGQRCKMGVCETDPCGEQCPFGQACNDNTGQCIADPCKVRQCPDGQWCNPNNNGQCEDDPCIASDVTCPNAGEQCRGGTCVDPDDFAVDAANESHVTVGGGGGCSTGSSSSGAILALLLGLFVSRRRRTVGGAR